MLNYFEIRITAMFPLSTVNNWTGFWLVGCQIPKPDPGNISLPEDQDLRASGSANRHHRHCITLQEFLKAVFLLTPHPPPCYSSADLFPFLWNGAIFRPGVCLRSCSWFLAGQGLQKWMTKWRWMKPAAPCHFSYASEWSHYEPMRHSRRGGREIAPFRQFVRLE